MTLITIKISDHHIDDLNRIAEHSGVEVSEMIDYIFKSGMETERSRMTSIGWNKEKKERSKERKENIYINNKASLSGKGGTGGKPLSLKPKASRKKPKRSMPGKYIEAADAGHVVGDPDILFYARQRGFSDTETNEMFIDFVNFHLKKGNKFVAWDRAWYTWVRNQIKFNSKKPKDVVRYHKQVNPYEGFSG
ncbi:MAG: hypothetical protein HKO79_06005 [Desulfobacterales bacterium]|nr:hypothetical protein [Desulfobacterales bacterium]